jgi:aspartate/methionine/tyrosine aminotransferase
MLKSKANVNMVVAQPPSYTHWENYLLPSLQAAYDFSDTKSRIKAVMICNPANLLSRCYSRKNILELMEFCQERGLHLIIEEVGSHTIVNSGDEKAPEFTSVLSLTEPLVPAGAVKVDPSRVHMVWSASEFLGLDGLRVVSRPVPRPTC